MLYSINYLDSRDIYSGVEIEADSLAELFNELHKYSIRNRYAYSKRGKVKEVLEIIEVNK